MKPFATYTLLVIYLMAAARPLLPWVSDCMAHTFNWHDHLEQVHKGHHHSHHVGEEMLQANKLDDAASAPLVPVFLFDKDALSAHTLPPILLWQHPFHILDVLNAAAGFYYLDIVGEVLVPPPNPGHSTL